MKLTFRDDDVFEDFTNRSFEDKDKYKKILSLIKDIKRNSYGGIGKPEQLKHDFSGYWSRHIDKEHRLVYRINEVEGKEDELIIIACKGHYE